MISGELINIFEYFFLLLFWIPIYRSVENNKKMQEKESFTISLTEVNRIRISRQRYATFQVSSSPGSSLEC